MKFTYPFKNLKIQSPSSRHTTKIQRSKTKTNQTHFLCNPKKPRTMSPTHSLPLFLLISLLLISTLTSSSDSDRVSELQSLQSRSKTGIIHLDHYFVSRYLTSTKTPRPYYLLIFFDATELHDKLDWEAWVRDWETEREREFRESEWGTERCSKRVREWIEWERKKMTLQLLLADIKLVFYITAWPNVYS